MYRRVLYQIIKPVVHLEYSDVRELAEKMKGADGDSDNISNACGDVLLRISGLLELVDFVFKETNTSDLD